MLRRRLTLPGGISRSASNSRAEIIQNAVLSVLEEVENATSAELAQAFGIPLARLRFQLQVLHGVGEIERGPRRAGSSAFTWRLPSAGTLVDCSEVGRSSGLALQDGKVKRDGLVAALFGPAGENRGS